MSETAEARSAFEAYRTALLGLELTHAWRGYGSTLMLEFGTLAPRARRDGTPGNATGEYSAMLEWSWRIESDNSILCGAWCDEGLWDAAIADLKGRKVTSLELFGRLPELAGSRLSLAPRGLSAAVWRRTARRRRRFSGAGL